MGKIMIMEFHQGTLEEFEYITVIYVRHQVPTAISREKIDIANPGFKARNMQPTHTIAQNHTASEL